MDDTILIVDDNEAFLDSAKDMLELEGYAVETAPSGREAIALADRRPFGLILMDIKMPDLSGVDCFMEIKKRRPDARVALMTAYSLEEQVQQALREGALAVLSKPLDIEKLLSLIKDRRTAPGGLILVADDDRAFCETMTDILTSAGYRVSIAHESRSIQEKIRRRPFDVMLLDMNLPGENGLMVYRRVRALYSRLVVILISGYGEEMKAQIDQTLSESALCFLSKPLDVDQLLSLLKRCFSDLGQHRLPEKGGL